MVPKLTDVLQESQQGVIELQEDDPDLVNLIVEWFYTGDYTITAATKASLTEGDAHVRLFELAGKYLLDDFKERVSRSLRGA